MERDKSFQAKVFLTVRKRVTQLFIELPSNQNNCLEYPDLECGKFIFVLSILWACRDM